jgi:hypothetical protein
MTRKEEVVELIYKDESYIIIGAYLKSIRTKAAVFTSRLITSAGAAGF